MKDKRKTFRKHLHDAAFSLSEAQTHLQNTEHDRWHIEEAINHIASAIDQHEELIKQEEKEAHQ